MSNQLAQDVATECRRLARNFGRLCLGDVSGSIVTQMEMSLSREPQIREKASLTYRKEQLTEYWGHSYGCEIGDLTPKTLEGFQSATMWYCPVTGQSVVNSNGDSRVLSSCWSTIHEWEFTGTLASQALEQLNLAGEWTAKRWAVLSELLWPGRVATASARCWPDVVNQVSELADDATLPFPDFPAAAMLVAMAAVVGCRVGIRPRRKFARSSPLAASRLGRCPGWGGLCDRAIPQCRGQLANSIRDDD
jgi:hypothetical protein